LELGGNLLRAHLWLLAKHWAVCGKLSLGLFGFKEAKSMSEGFQQFYEIIKPIGYAIGYLAGSILNGLVFALVVAVKVIDNFIWAVGKIGEALWQFGKITGINSLISGFVSLVVGAFKFVYNTVSSIVTEISYWFGWLGKYLVFNSVVPDMCLAIGVFFAKMALKVLSTVGSFVFKLIKFFAMLPFKILGFFLKLPFKIMKGLFNTFVKWPIKMFGKLLNFMTGMLNKAMGMMLKD
jgi:hypothetical protein